METVYVIDAVRTAIGRYGGALSSIRPDDLLADVIKGLVVRNQKIDVNEIEDVIAGDANQAGEDNRNVARMAALIAGLPVSVAGNTVNRLCASGLQAIMDASRAIMVGDGNIFLAGGVESMTRAPFVMAKSDGAFSRKSEIYDSTIGWRFPNRKLTEKYFPFSMGETAENVAKQWNISRESQDEFAFNSQQKYYQALAAGKWESEIVPVEITPNKTDKVIFQTDEHPRKSSLEKLAQLKPAFIKEGTVTAGNSSGINDGAAMLLLANEETVKKYDLKPMAKIISMAVAGVDPSIMGIGPVAATKKALSRAGLSVSDINLVELNEAFASQSVAVIRTLELDPEKVNINGGAIALGHPLGCTGAKLTVQIINDMKRLNKKYGIVTACVGGGQGIAGIIENIN